MARNMYGATSADFTLTSGGRVVPGATLTIWSARTGGTQITDLLDVDSVATTTVTSDADGSIVYYGPNNDKTVHWADSGVGNRIAVRPTDITGDPPVLSIGTVGTGAAAASLTGTSEAPVLNLTLPTAGANGVNTAAIQDGAVTSAKIADGAVGNVDIAATAAISRLKIAEPNVFVSTLAWPQVAAHRLGASNYGEETMRSAEMSVAAGLKVLECDFWLTSDGEAVLMHDSTIDRTTTGTGTVSTLTAAQIAAARVDVWGRDVVYDAISGDGYRGQRIATIDEIVARFRGRAVIFAEDKGISAESVATLAARWRQSGFLDSMVIQSDSGTRCQAWAAQGFTVMQVAWGALPDPAATKASGIDWVAYPLKGGTPVSGATITAAKAAGLNVASFTHDTFSETATAFALGVDAAMSSAPAMGRALDYLDFADGVRPAGCTVKSVTDGAQQLVQDGYWYAQNDTREVGFNAYALGPIDSDVFTVEAVYRHVGAISAPTKWGSIYLEGPDASEYKGAATYGYHVLARWNGTVQIYRVPVGGGPTSIGSASGAALAADTDITLRVTVTPTTITGTVVGGATCTVTDSTFRPVRWPSWGRVDGNANVGLRSMQVSL